jgi:ADP-heptose:LPS heptosyltransferase
LKSGLPREICRPVKASGPRILVIRRRYLGDIVLLGSLFRNLRLHWPKAQLSALIDPAYAGVLSLNPDVDEIVAFPQSTVDWPKTILKLRRCHFTHVIDLDNREKTALLTSLTGAPERICLRHGEPIKFPSLYTDSESVSAEFLSTHHITDFYLHALGKIGVPVATREVRLTVRPEDVAFASGLLQEANIDHPRAKLLVHPGSRSPWRIWPAKNFAAVIDRAQEELGVAVAFIAGPGEQSTVTEITQHLKHPAARIKQQLTIPQLAALFTRFDAMLCHDSGPMHLAAAVGARVVALFGSQPVNLWRPVGEGHAMLSPPLPCVNCVAPDQCKPHDAYHNYCVRNIAPDRVIAAVGTALGSPDRRQAAGR